MLKAIIFCALLWQADYSILNFDKVLAGTDKTIQIQPPQGKYWTIYQGTTTIEHPIDGATFVLWLENAPYAPYRDPRTGEMKGCVRCLTLRTEDAGKGVLFEVKGQSMPLVVSYPNRLMIAITPTHGGLDAPLKTWTRLAVIERDLN